MENFFIAFKAVLVMAIYALPGYLLMKSKKINESVIPQLSVILMYICNSFLAVYAFGLTKCTNKLLKEIGIFFVVSVFLVLFMLFMTYFILVKNCTIKKFLVVQASICQRHRRNVRLVLMDIIALRVLITPI